MATVPVLDIRRFDRASNPSEDERRGFIDDLGRAYREHGFVGIRGHGIPDAVLRAAYAAVRELFALPLERRAALGNAGPGGVRGYTGYGVEHARDNVMAPDLKEFWQIGREFEPGTPGAELVPANVWPSDVVNFRDRTWPLFEALDALSRTVLTAVALHLGLDSDYFDDKVDRGNSVLRCLHYPPLPGEGTGNRVRSAAHEDINLITLLIGSGEPGLEILGARGDWIPVDTIPGTIVCNVGDMLQRLTNHVLRSTTHRVVNPPPPHDSRSRFSIPFFVHPNGEFLIETLPGCITERNPNRYPEPITADAFLRQRLVEIGLASAGSGNTAGASLSGTRRAS